MIVLNVGFGVCQDIYLQVMDQYVAEIPKIIESRTKEFTMRSRVYEEDALTRAELGLKLFAEGDGLSDAERLERVRDAVSADSVSLLDGQGQVLSTTGPVSPVERFSAAVRELEPHKSRLEFYPSDEKTDEETAGYAGKGLVLLPVPGSAKRSLVFEFDCESVLKLYNALGKWSDVLNRLVSGELAAGFAKTGDMIEGYPVDSLSDAEREQLYDEVENLFLNSGKFRRRGDTSASRLVTLLGDRYLAALSHCYEVTFCQW